MANNILSLSGIPVDICPPERIRSATDKAIVSQLQQQIISFQNEVANLHQFTQLMDEYGDEVLQGFAMQMAVNMRHFDNRLTEMESLVTELQGRTNG